MILNAAFDDDVLHLLADIKRSKDIFYLHFDSKDFTLLLSLSEKEMNDLTKVATKSGIKVYDAIGGTIKGSNLSVQAKLFKK